ALIEFWEKGRVYERMQEAAAGLPRFVLHDGPPYANVQIHIGHALNKTLKDITVKARALLGQQAPYSPGWDCHGLPIEHALLKELGLDKRSVKDVPAFRRKAAEFARRFIDIQRAEFRRLGVLGEWDRPYLTMEPAYEARVLSAFRRLLAAGYIYRGLKPVYWCVYCETALAEAEVEYKDKTSPSVYVAFPIAKAAQPELVGAEVLVWTTTPWTLPANMAVAFHPDLDYVLVDAGGRRLLAAKARVEALAKTLGQPGLRELGSWKGRELAPVHPQDRGALDFRYQAPFGGREGVGVLADYVTAEDGTGAVHTAPGHGADDFYTGRRYGIEILCPVDHAGRFTAQAGELAGKQVFKEGNPEVLERLEAEGRLLASGEVSHSYPHCWRCKNPVIFRATEQWFLSVDREGLREKLLKAVGEVAWVPAVGRARISAMVEGRPDWCLSRQRVWGTPIPVLFCAACAQPVTDDDALQAIETRVATEGSDFWFVERERPVTPREAPSGELVWDFLPGDLRCHACKGRSFRRETDILDVWMDSGASWLGVLEPKGQVPCDLYLEGSDQHRGWFQSSLVLSTALEGRAPYRTVLTHGFVLDDHGRAMHKSLGNVVSPQEVIDKVGADVLRLWVALADYSDDVRLSAKLLEGPAEAYRKVRNTWRYLLGNVCDFDPAKDLRRGDELGEMDRYLLHRLAALIEAARAALLEFRYRDAARLIVDFCNLDLSSFYLDACKDKLYTLARHAPQRRSAQTVMYHCLEALLTLAAPILSFTAEEAWTELRRLHAELGSARRLPESVFLAQAPAAPAGWRDEGLQARWSSVLAVRAAVHKGLEALRSQGKLGSSLQAKVVLTAGGPERPVLEALREQLPEILLVSQVELRAGDGELQAEVERAEGSKCARCWRWQKDVGADAAQPALCQRCVRQLAAS
ncbi:MAG: isoleucine--tRNA ligase, partial [Elusimicrobia bacterium]|nr:isoleucine--tRNA ligase [Elusimicrobiota bacterium]